MSTARAKRPRGILARSQSAKERQTRRGCAIAGCKAQRHRGLGDRLRDQPISDAAHGQEIDGRQRDRARSCAAAARAGRRRVRSFAPAGSASAVARNGLAAARASARRRSRSRSVRRTGALPVAQFAAPEMERERRRSAPLRRGAAARAARRRAPQDRLDAQQEFARLERLAEIVVGAGLEAADAVGGFGPRRQHQHRRRRAVAAVARSQATRSSPLSPGIITSTTARSKASAPRCVRASAASQAIDTRNPSRPR